MRISTGYRQCFIFGETRPVADGRFVATGTVCRILPDQSSAPPDVRFDTLESFLTESAACSGGITTATKIIDAFWAADGDLPTHVLLVEDSPGDVRLTLEAFQEVDPSIRLHVAADGMEAMTFLRRQGVHGYQPRPDLILLDLNMPKMDGREVLALIKNDDNLRTIPIVILSSSEMESDVAGSYHSHANCYLRKPIQYDEFRDLVRGIHQFWLAGAPHDRRRLTSFHLSRSGIGP
jgi:two-component system, chemotaxis family, response regulator Rcp1